MKKRFKRIILGIIILSGVTIFFSSIQAMGGPTFPYENGEGWKEGMGSLESDYGSLMKNHSVENQNSLLNRMFDVFNLDITETGRYNGPLKALYYARYLINYALSFVAFIALCLLMYSFYCVIIGDEKQIDKAKSYFKGIAVAIIVTALSRLIVSLIFRIYEDIAERNSKGGANQGMSTIQNTQNFNLLV